MDLFKKSLKSGDNLAQRAETSEFDGVSVRRVPGKHLYRVASQSDGSGSNFLDWTRATLDQLDLALLVCTPRFGQLTYCNTAYERIWERSSKSLQMAPLDWLDAIIAEDRSSVQKCVRRLISNSKPVEGEFHIHAGNDQLKAIEWRGFALKDNQSRVVQVVVTFRDVTQRMKDQADAKDREARFHLAVQGINEGMWDWHIPSQKVHYSPRWKEQLGYGERSIGDSFDEWKSRVHPDDLPRALRLIDDFFAGRVKHFSMEHRLKHKDGSYRWILSRGALQRDDHGKPLRLAGSHQDITERKELERQLLETTERERRNIGHDLHEGLGQRLTALELMSQALVERLREQAPDSIATSREINRQIRATISHIRLLARGISPVSLDASSLADALRELAQATQLGSGFEVTVETDPKVAIFDASAATHLYRIAQEAVSNALKHGRATRISIRLENNGKENRLVIEDNGRGFGRKKSRPQGLGLRVMDYRARLFGATLSVSSDRPGGVTITCIFASPI